MFAKLGCALLVTLLVACEKKEQPPTPAPETNAANEAPATTVTPVAEAAQPAVDVETLSVEEDFEELAEKELTAANITVRLDELEKELGAQ